MAERNFGRVHKALGQYVAVPLVILDDARLSDLAVRVAAQLSRRINYGAWNTEGRVDMSYTALAARVGKSRWSVMRAVADLVSLGYLVEPTSLHRGGMRFWFNTGWSDEDETGYIEWATSGFMVSPQGRIEYSGFDADAPYCDALEQGFPTVDARDRWAQRAKDSLERWTIKARPAPEYPAARLYVLGIREHMLSLREAGDLYSDEGQKQYGAAMARLAHNGPSRQDLDLAMRNLKRAGNSSNGATTPNSDITTKVLAMMSGRDSSSAATHL